MRLFFCFILFQISLLSAQNDSNKNFKLSGYGELYYSYDFSNPENRSKENFIYNHKKHHELQTNLVFVKGAYASNLVRANLALMTGNYAQYNLSSEPNWAQSLFEANVGIKLSVKHNIWLDAGIMPSHIGFESAISADCWTLTRSILAENSPYYENGIKVSFTNKKENLNIAFLVLNGWQRIQPEFLNKPSVGVQFNYKPNNALMLNYSNFINTTQQNNFQSIRSFHNLYLQYESDKKWGLIAGFDIGNDKFNPSQYGIWYSPVMIVRYALNPLTKIALRAEYYNDNNQIIIPTNTESGYQVKGISSNLDYKINERTVFRIEGKMYHSDASIFQNNSNTNYSFTTNLTVKI